MGNVPYFDDKPPDRRERPPRGASPRPYRERGRDASRAARSARAGQHAAPASRRAPDAAQRQPLSTQESRDLAQMSRETYEAARARRDARFPHGAGRTSNRELIDGRGSIDSRAFNENNELVGYSIDKRDKPEPLVDAVEAGSRWSSRGGQGFASGEPRRAAPRGGRASRRQDLDSLSDTISGRAQYGGSKPSPALPKSAVFLIVLIVILLVVLAVILFF